MYTRVLKQLGIAKCRFDICASSFDKPLALCGQRPFGIRLVLFIHRETRQTIICEAKYQFYPHHHVVKFRHFYKGATDPNTKYIVFQVE